MLVEGVGVDDVGVDDVDRMEERRRRANDDDDDDDDDDIDRSDDDRVEDLCAGLTRHPPPQRIRGCMGMVCCI